MNRTYKNTCRLQNHSVRTFILSVEETSSAIALFWLPWKWIAISKSISPNDDFDPDILQTHIQQQYRTFDVTSSLLLPHAADWRPDTQLNSTVKQYYMVAANSFAPNR